MSSNCSNVIGFTSLNIYTKHFISLSVFTLESLTQHPDKTFIGRVGKGFDWMGYQFDGTGVIAASPRTLEKHNTKLRQLYELACRHKLSTDDITRRVAEYWVRWQRWLLAGLSDALTTALSL